jgi:nitrate reductase NapE component
MGITLILAVLLVGGYGIFYLIDRFLLGSGTF